MRQELLKKRDEDPFHYLGVSAEDKMSFFLLKWVFNAIKIESSKNDELLKGHSYVTKKEVVTQLAKNSELMSALNLTNSLVLKDEIKRADCAKNDCLTWREFLNFFFKRGGQPSGADWWTKLDPDGKRITEKPIDKLKAAQADVDIQSQNNEIQRR